MISIWLLVIYGLLSWLVDLIIAWEDDRADIIFYEVFYIATVVCFLIMELI